jgi:hypothetical protein
LSRAPLTLALVAVRNNWMAARVGLSTSGSIAFSTGSSSAGVAPNTSA